VSAAATVTLCAVGVAAACVLVAALGFVVFGSIVLPLFDTSAGLVAIVVGTLVLLLALCGAAAFSAYALLRRRRWAWRALLALSVVSLVLDLLAAPTAGFVVPIALAVAALAVHVLLLLPSTRAWLRDGRPA
jgi:hypothetical protein